jgi:hypothetical protein
MASKRKSRERMKVGRRLLAVPGVPSVTGPDSSAPATTPPAGEAEADELDEKLTRTIKAAYQ